MTVPVPVVVTVAPVVALPLLVILHLSYPMIAIVARVFRGQLVQRLGRAEVLCCGVGHRGRRPKEKN